MTAVPKETTAGVGYELSLVWPKYRRRLLEITKKEKVGYSPYLNSGGKRRVYEFFSSRASNRAI